MSEHEKNEQGACPSCGSPSHAGHTADCPANKQIDKIRLSSDQAEAESEQIRSQAANIKAKRDLGERRTEEEYHKAVYLDGMAGAERIAAELHQESLEKHARRILDNEASQPSKQDYDRGEESVERIKKSVERIKKRL